jgi:hypothetical protein
MAKGFYIIEVENTTERKIARLEADIKRRMDANQIVDSFTRMSLERLKTVLKWEKSGLLDGLQGHVGENIAQLYENQSRELLNE